MKKYKVIRKEIGNKLHKVTKNVENTSKKAFNVSLDITKSFIEIYFAIIAIRFLLSFIVLIPGFRMILILSFISSIINSINK